MTIEESFETIDQKRKRRVILGVLSLSISFGLFAIVNFLISGMLNLTIAVGWALLILSVILFALGLYLLVYHPMIEVDGEWTGESRPPHIPTRPTFQPRIRHIERKNRQSID